MSPSLSRTRTKQLLPLDQLPTLLHCRPVARTSCEGGGVVVVAAGTKVRAPKGRGVPSRRTGRNFFGIFTLKWCVLALI